MAAIIESASIVAKKGLVDRFKSIQEETGLDTNGLLEFFFQLHECNKKQMKTNMAFLNIDCPPKMNQLVGVNQLVLERVEIKPELSTSAQSSTSAHQQKSKNSPPKFLIIQEVHVPEKAKTAECAGNVPESSRTQENQESKQNEEEILKENDDSQDSEKAASCRTEDKDRSQCYAEDNKQKSTSLEPVAEVMINEKLSVSILENNNTSKNEDSVIKTADEQDKVKDLLLEDAVKGSDKDMDLTKTCAKATSINIIEDSNNNTTDVNEKQPESEKKLAEISSDIEKVSGKRKRRNEVWLTRVQDSYYEERQYKCRFCAAAFFHSHHLHRHERQLHKQGNIVKPNQCKDCFKTFATLLTMRYHQDYACKMVSRPFRCASCQLGFKEEKKLAEHKCSKTPKKPLCCPSCEYKTGSPRDMEHHLRIHSGERCYKCELCDFRTAWRKNLKEHIVKHTGLKPFKCDNCDFATNDKSNLRSHRTRHHKGKVYVCEVCKMSFRENRFLKSHKLIHSSARPHKCPHCEYTARFKSCLKKHMCIHNRPVGEKADTDEAVLQNEVLESVVGEKINDKEFYFCDGCGFMSNSFEVVKNHICKDVKNTVTAEQDVVIQIIETSADYELT